MRKLILAATLCATVAGCATQSTANAVATLQSGYIAAASAESVYLSSGKADPAVVSEIEKYRLPAYNDIEPLVQAQESGGSVTSVAQVEAAQAALNALTTYLSNEGIK